MKEKNDLNDLKNTIKDITPGMSTLATASNTDAFRNASASVSALSNAFKEANLASTQIAVKNMASGMSALVTASNTDAFRNASASVSALSNAFKKANLASTQIAMKSIAAGMSTLATASNTDAFRNASASVSALSNAFKEANLASTQIAVKNMASGMSALVTASNTDAFRNASASVSALSNAFKKANLLDNYSEIISEIDWQNFNPTEINIKQAYTVLEDEHVEEKISKELNNIKNGKGIIAYLSSIMVTIYLIIGFCSDFITVIEYTEQTVYPAIQSLSDHVFDSDKIAIKWLNNELKQDVPTQLTNNFRIVTKDDLVVREGKKVDSRIKGKLNSKDVVQIIEKKRNWTYISYSNYEDNEYVEGWVFTKYLKQIK